MLVPSSGLAQRIVLDDEQQGVIREDLLLDAARSSEPRGVLPCQRRRLDSGTGGAYVR
jgi:hypothetical protein